MIIIFWVVIFIVNSLFPGYGISFMIGSIFGIFLVTTDGKLLSGKTFRRWVDKGRRQGYDGKESCLKENA